MTTEALGSLRTQMLALPERERAQLARDLIKSLDAPMDEGVAEAWDKEILRRLAQVDAGQAKLFTLDTLHDEIQSALDLK